MAFDSPPAQYQCPECGSPMEFDAFWSTEFQTTLDLWSCPACRTIQHPDEDGQEYIKAYCQGEAKGSDVLLPVLIATDAFLG